MYFHRLFFRYKQLFQSIQDFAEDKSISIYDYSIKKFIGNIQSKNTLGDFIPLAQDTKLAVVTNDKNISIFLYSAGVIGVFTVLFSNFTFVPLGASLTMALGLLGQTVSAIIIDHFGLFGVNVIKFNRKKLVGLAIICLGLVIMTIY